MLFKRSEDLDDVVYIRRLLDAGMERAFPNPRRIGCPTPDALKGMALHRAPISVAASWTEHLSSCGPCYIDITKFQRIHKIRTRALLSTGVLAAVIIAFLSYPWAPSTQSENAIAGNSRAPVPEPAETQPDTQLVPILLRPGLSRSSSRLEIVMPTTRSVRFDLWPRGVAATYRVTVGTPDVLDKWKGTAEQAGHVVTVVVPTEIFSPGNYTIRLQGSDLQGKEWEDLATYYVRVAR